MNSYMDSWMRMTREQRRSSYEEYKKLSMNRKKTLLSEIRKEYLDLDKKK